MSVAEKLSSGSNDSVSQLQMDAPTIERFRKQGLYGLGESYIEGLWNAERLDDLMFRLITQQEAAGSHLSPRLAAHALMEKFLNPQRGAGVFEVADRHYNLGNDLFEVMLDSTMTYTCGYWKEARTLDAAQTAKLDLSCRKLKLEKGMRVLDIGCGWGNFAKFAADRFGVSVVGVTVAKEQASLARERCNGLPVEIVLKDYREIDGKFDRVVSLEMNEAVGRKNLDAFFEVAHRSLEPHGLFLLEVISCETFSSNSSIYMDQFIMWLAKYIFPNGYLPNMEELSRPCRNLFVMEDLHNFGADYDRTLQEWETNFELGWPKLHGQYDEAFRRRWRFYLAGCAAVFRARMVQLYQIVYSKDGVQGVYEAVR